MYIVYWYFSWKHLWNEISPKQWFYLFYNENTLFLCNYVYVSIAKKVATVAKTAKYCSIFAVKFEKRQFSGTSLDKYWHNIAYFGRKKSHKTQKLFWNDIAWLYNFSFCKNSSFIKPFINILVVLTSKCGPSSIFAPFFGM